MGDYNMGPEWFWKMVGVLAAFGLLALLAGIIAGIIWLFNHIKFV